LEFAKGRARTENNPYSALLEAVKGGKKVKVLLEEGKALKNLKWGLSQAAKKEGMKIDMRVLADQSGVVVSMQTIAQVAQSTQDEDGEPKSDATPAGPKSRK